MNLRLFAAAILFFSVLKSATAQEVTLEQVVALALEKNYDVQVQRKSVEAAKTDNGYAWAAFTPQLSATGTTVWSENPSQELRFRDREPLEGSTAANNLNAAAQLSWTLFDGTRMFSARERIGVLAEQSQFSLKDVMTNTISTVIASYYDIVRQKQQLKAIQEQMYVSEERVKLAERKLEVGTGIKPELLQAKVDLNTQRAQVIQQESIIEQLKQQLNALVGLQLPNAYDVADTIIINLGITPADIIPEIENKNYSLLAARQNIHISNLLLKERRAEYLPFLSFNAAYTYSKTENTKLLNPFGPIFLQQNGYNYGFTVNIPILNGFNTRRLNQQARIEVDRQTLLYDQLKTNVNVALNNAYINYDNAKKILLIEEETIAAAKENVSIALQTFKAGATTSVELRIAQQSLADAYSRLITARYNAKLAETELLRLNGSLLK